MDKAVTRTANILSELRWPLESALETMNEVLPKIGPKIIIDEDAKQFLPLLNLK